MIFIILLIWRGICLYNWLIHPEETLYQTIKQWKMLHKIFFFVPFLVPYKYYERNPESAIRSYKTSEIMMILLFAIASILAIITILAGK